MTDIRDDVRDSFQTLYGYEPSGLWSAPGRINLLGGHTGCTDGLALSLAIDRRTVIGLGLREDGIARVANSLTGEMVETPLSELASERLTGWSAYPLGVVCALGRRGADLAAVPGFDILIDSDVPAGAGLSSSAALESAVALALNDVWRLGLDRAELARIGRVAKPDAVGAPAGVMNQAASLLARKDSAVFVDCRSLAVETVELGFEPAGLVLVVIDTGISHEHATSGHAERRASCELGARMLGVTSLREVGVDDLPRARELLDDVTFRRVRHVVTENQRVLDTVHTLRESGPLAIGDLLDASHRSMRDDLDIFVPELDLAVETALENGAIGVRMMGGGFGGTAIALLPGEHLSRLQVAIDGAFAEHGYGQPDTFVVTAGSGASREP